ncbi:MAG: hypothetical protein M3Y22_15420 [Pseudomonadota bacterium]|nr:hypothetical protein [Pseudomonadota bacterium]
MVDFDRGAINCLDDRHGRMFGQQLGHQALVRRVKVLDQDEGHAWGLRQGIDQLGDSF